MESDEELARRLQAEFDEEARAAEEQDHKDAALAQSLASQSHNLSSSEGEDEDDDKRVAHTTTKPHKNEASSSQVATEHTMSEEEEEEKVSPHLSQETPLPRASSNSAPPAYPSPQQAGNGQSYPPKRRPLCKFGSSCYRKNPWHLEEFAHPHLEGQGGNIALGTVDEVGNQQPTKKLKKSPSSEVSKKVLSYKLPFPERLAASTPFNFFLNKCYSVEETQKDTFTLVFPDLLNPQLGELVESAQLNFMVDLDFLMTNYKSGRAENKPLLVMYGQMEGNQSDYPNLTCTKVNLPFQYGTHHTKAMLFLYRTGLRLVIHTANLVPDDWYEKTQGFWVSPLFPELENGKASVLDGESPSRFKRDLVEYLQSYKAPGLTRWANIVKKYDFSSCRVVLVGSAPGYHMGEQKDTWGHMKLRRALHNHASPWKASLPIIIQCSSIGSLGKDHRSWLSGELGLSLCGAPGVCANPPKMNVVYPSEEDIRTSSQGWMGGSCLPYNSSTHERQTWLTDHLHVWRSDLRQRTRAMPHIKTYTRLDQSLTKAQFFLLTSANLSKAAWGSLQKQNSQLFIRSYELGVLLLPKFLTDNTELQLGTPGSPSSLALPYDLPLTPYPSGASPWFMNTSKKTKDVFGRTYP